MKFGKEMEKIITSVEKSLRKNSCEDVDEHIKTYYLINHLLYSLHARHEYFLKSLKELPPMPSDILLEVEKMKQLLKSTEFLLVEKLQE